MIKMSGQSAVGSEGDHYLRTNAADAQHQLACRLVEIGTIELAVKVVEHLAVIDVEDLERLGKFGASQSSQFFVRRRAAAVARGRAFGQADDRGLDPTLVIVEQRAAKGAGLVVRMGGNTQKFAHKLCWRVILSVRKNCCLQSVTICCSVSLQRSRCRSWRIVITSAVSWREGSAVRDQKQIPPRAEALVVMTIPKGRKCTPEGVLHPPRGEPRRLADRPATCQ